MPVFDEVRRFQRFDKLDFVKDLNFHQNSILFKKDTKHFDFFRFLQNFLISFLKFFLQIFSSKSFFHPFKMIF